jgi:hypothetical protein
MITVAPANQRVPAHYLNRHFAIQFNLPKLGKLTHLTRKFPSLGQDNALALAALAANRLEVALRGQAQANDGQVAGSVAAWAAEVTAARAEVNEALVAVRAAFPTFSTAAQVYAKLDAEFAQAIPGPSQLNVAWATT